MKRLIAAALAAGCLSLAGCGLASLVGISPATQTTVHLDTGKALDAVYGALDFVAVGLIEPAVVDGSIKGATAAKLSAQLKQARSILDTAYAAYHAGTASDPTTAINSVLQMIADAKTVLNGAGVATTSAAAPTAWRGPDGARTDLDRVALELRSA